MLPNDLSKIQKYLHFKKHLTRKLYNEMEFKNSNLWHDTPFLITLIIHFVNRLFYNKIQLGFIIWFILNNSCNIMTTKDIAFINPYLHLHVLHFEEQFLNTIISVFRMITQPCVYQKTTTSPSNENSKYHHVTIVLQNGKGHAIRLPRMHIKLLK